MNEFTPNDLERLARGEPVAPEAFRAILASSEAADQLTKLIKVRELFEEATDAPALTEFFANRPGVNLSLGLGQLRAVDDDVPAMNVSFEELALHVEGRLKDPARQAAVAQFLHEQLPDLPPPLPPLRRLGHAVLHVVVFLLGLPSVVVQGAVSLFSRQFARPRDGGAAGAPDGSSRGWVLVVLKGRAIAFSCGIVVGGGLSIWLLVGAEARALQDRIAAAAAEAEAQEAENKRAEAEADAEKYWYKVNKSEQQISAAKYDSFDKGLQKAISYRLQTYLDQPDRLGLRFDQPLGLPYFVGLEVLWAEGSEPERLFEANRIPPEPLYTHQYKLPLNEQGVTLLLRFHTTPETMQKAGVGPIVEEKVPLILSPRGVRIPSEKEQRRVIASISQPKDDQAVGSVFRLDFHLQRPAQARASQPTRTIHILVRALDGCQKCQEDYFVVPFHMKVDDLSDYPQHYPTFVSLRGILAGVPKGEKLPTRFEVLVVDLPSKLENWMIGKSEMGGEVCIRRTVVLRPEKTDE
jgi:hypothetical protein